MFRFIGLLAGCGLVAATVWIAHQTRAQEGFTEPNPFAESAQPADQPAPPPEEPNPFVDPASTPATPETEPSATPAASVGSEVSRRRVEDYLRQARLAWRQGDSAEALRLARTADRLAREWNVTFKSSEQTPSALIASFSSPADTQSPAERATPATELPEEIAQQREYVQLLLDSAEEFLAKGNFEAARQKAVQAQAVNVPYGPLDRRPEHVLAEIARLQPADAAGPSDAFLASWERADAAPETQQTSGTAPQAAQPANPREQAAELLKLARAAIDGQRFDEARDLALEAQRLEAAYELFDDRPEYVLAEVERHTETKIITPQSARPAEAFAESMTSEQVAHCRQEALSLLAEARTLLEQGDHAAAHAKAEAAAQLQATFELFDDRPELVQQDIQKAAGDGHVASQSAPVAGPPLPTHTLAPSPEKEQALALLREARKLLTSGELQAAREKAEAAARIEVTYNLFEDRPEAVLQELDRLGGQGLQNSGDTPAPATLAQDVPYLPMPVDVTESQAMPASESMTRDALVTDSSGLSAQEWYNRGVEHLRQGDRQAAYDAFVEASHLAAQLHPQQRQQLQDKLRSLAPSRQIQQVAAEEYSPAPTSGELSLESTEIDGVVAEHAARYDRTRTEVLNTIFRAERLRDESPEEALQLLDQAIASLEQNELSPQQVSPLLAALKHSRNAVDASMAQRKPLLDLKQHNAETRDRINTEMETRIRVEQEIAELVDKFNQLMDERRYAEANTVAKQAKELDPENAVVIQMEIESRFAYRNDRNRDLIDKKEESVWKTLDDVERAAIANVGDSNPMVYDLKRWEDFASKRQPVADALQRSPEEVRVQQSLTRPVSLNLTDSPLAQVMADIASMANINVVIDEQGLTDEGVTTNTPITIIVDGIQLKSALNLILRPLNLDYTIEDEVLKITSRLRQQGELIPVVYPVADLVVPIPSQKPSVRMSPFGGALLPGANIGIPGGPMSVAGTGGQQSGSGYGFHQINDAPQNPLLAMAGLPGVQEELQAPESEYDFVGLTELITTTVAPESWQEFAGDGSIGKHPTTLSLVIRQTQRVHQEISDLLGQLRRLQDLQVTIEVRFITVSDRFFERIGIDFDFNVNDDVGGPIVDNTFVPLNRFGTVDPVNGGLGGVGAAAQQGQAGAQAGGAAGAAGAAGAGGQVAAPTAPFAPGPLLNLVGRDNWGDGVVVGMVDPGTFSSDLDIPFRQGSFELGVPEFGGFNPESGIRFGMAILSDIEAFLFVQAAQGDERSNLMFAPKITLFNGQIGSVSSFVARPFVTSVIPVVSAFAVGFQPVVQQIPDGIFMTVQAVVSADRRYVRLAVSPNFTNVTDVFTFSFVSGAQPTAAAIGGAGGGIGGAGGGIGGAGGGIGGAGGGIGGGGGGFGGGGGGGGFGGAAGGGGGIQGGQQGGGTGGGSITVQQPVQEIVNVSTVVSVPDGGTVLLGGIKRLREGRSMNGVPILNKIPYVSRLFKNTGVGRETESLMLMVTPRIIIQEEEEELLGQ